MKWSKTLIFILIFSFLSFSPLLWATTALDMTSFSPNMGNVDANDYDACEYEATRLHKIKIKSDTDWIVWVHTVASDMGTVSGYTKPISDFFLKARGNLATQDTYRTIDITGFELARGNASPNKWKKINLDYKVLLDWTLDLAGDYNIELIYTLTSQ